MPSLLAYARDVGSGRIGTCAATALAVSSLSHCVGATEIMLDLHTDVSCAVVGVRGVTIAVGEPNDETTGIVTSATSCDAGSIGTLALLPRGDIGGPVAVRVVLGVNTKADDCAAPNAYSGCIVARRSLRYSPHAKLTLPIDLDQDCLDDPCGPDSTCVHGSCTDAGTTCEGNVCGIDAGAIEAGPPDAGACNTSALIGSTSVAATPHIARAAQGYAIAWFTDPGTIYAEIVDTNGHIVVPARLIAQISGTTKLDAIATDANDQSYFVVYEDGATVYAAVAPTAGAGSASNAILTSTGAVGAFRDPNLPLWVAGAITSGTASLYSFGSGLKTQFSTSPATHYAIAQHGSTYYTTTTEGGGGCTLRTCTLQSQGAFSCFQNDIIQGCSSMRAAADASHVILSYVANGTLTFELINGQTVPSGPIDDIDAMVPLVVGSTPYRLVWRSTDAILTDTFPTRQAAATTIDASGYGSTAAGGAGFDAVADDPAQTGYAVVYYRQGGTIQFAHRCQ